MSRSKLGRIAIWLFIGIVIWRSYQNWSRDRLVEFRIEGNGNEITAIAFSPDGSTLAFSSRRQPMIHIWDLRSRQKKYELKRRNVTDFLRFSSSGELVGKGPSNDDYARVWDTNGQVSKSFPTAVDFESAMPEFVCDHRFEVDVDEIGEESTGSISVSMFEKVTGDIGRSLRFEGMKRSKTLKSSSCDVFALVLEPRPGNVQNERAGITLLSNRANGDITSLPTREYRGNFTIDVSPDGAFVAFYEIDGSIGHGIDVWNIASLNRTGSFPYRSRSQPPIIRFSPDSKTIAIAGGDYGYDDLLYGRHGFVNFLEVSTMRPIDSVHSVPIVTAIEFAADGRRLAVGFDDGSIDILDASFREVHDGG